MVTGRAEDRGASTRKPVKQIYVQADTVPEIGNICSRTNNLTNEKFSRAIISCDAACSIFALLATLRTCLQGKLQELLGPICIIAIVKS